MDSVAVDHASPDALERPTGRFDRVPSRVSGRTLTFFSPDPFPTLLARYAASSCGVSAGNAVGAAGFRSAHEALLLIRGAIGFRSMQSRCDEARAFIDVLSARSPPREGRDPLLSLGLPVAHAPRRLRCELAFSGARVASEGHVFAHDGDVEPLFDSLCDGLLAPQPHIPVTVLVACAAFHALHVHPFADGNGRWARLLAAWVGASRGASVSGVVHACLLQLGKPALVERYWPHARSHGMGGYLLRCHSFERRVVEVLRSRALPESMAAIHAGIKGVVVSPRLRADVIAALVANGRIERTHLKRVAGISSRALDGALLRIAEHSACEIESATGDLDANPLMTQVDDVLRAALQATFHD
ncbi:Fic family protein [Noviluteimonas gilva]|uniref:Fido domain-containing protein n=1 Tax=Noviluteimonas gilva TaxID=2682097 RepID=A0A7C9M5K1_9GAMM|nr:Fic family protein [Lysobacter gilvus]MUV15502.1 hypothetical protein [Lysobacter gilvus]